MKIHTDNESAFQSAIRGKFNINNKFHNTIKCTSTTASDSVSRGWWILFVFLLSLRFCSFHNFVRAKNLSLNNKTYKAGWLQFCFWHFQQIIFVCLEEVTLGSSSSLIFCFRFGNIGFFFAEKSRVFLCVFFCCCFIVIEQFAWLLDEHQEQAQ